MKEIILASKSPRRKMLLKQIGINPIIMPTNYQEKHDLMPNEQVLANAKGKALWLEERIDDNAIIIAADTVVTLDGEILAKPRSKNQAYSMLKKLSARTHFVLSAIYLLDNITKNYRSELVKTEVIMRKILAFEIENYISTNEAYDKAGGYAIQGRASIFIEKIIGSYSNVVGLPLAELAKHLAELDFLVANTW